jgi:hypothetical protein
MPFLSSSSGVQINGGNFYDIAGDMNVQGGGASSPRERLITPQFGPTEGVSSLAPERNNRNAGGTRMTPYGALRPNRATKRRIDMTTDISHRRHSLNLSNRSSLCDSDHRSIYSNPALHGFYDTGLEPPSLVDSLGGLRAYPSVSPDPPTSFDNLSCSLPTVINGGTFITAGNMDHQSYWGKCVVPILTTCLDDS